MTAAGESVRCISIAMSTIGLLLLLSHSEHLRQGDLPRHNCQFMHPASRWSRSPEPYFLANALSVCDNLFHLVKEYF